MKLLRPHIPLSVRCVVVERQLRAADLAWSIPETGAVSHRLAMMLLTLFGKESPNLDHQPALALRDKVFKDGEHVGYRPAANDPEFLIYRTRRDHDIKTRVRNGAQFSDHALIRRSKRKAKRAKPRQKIPQRKKPWPKRKMQSKSTLG